MLNSETAIAIGLRFSQDVIGDWQSGIDWEKGNLKRTFGLNDRVPDVFILFDRLLAMRVSQ